VDVVVPGRLVQSVPGELHDLDFQLTPETTFWTVEM
jgi:hypothetical protein